MLSLFLILAAMLVIALIYAIFDTFNHRDIPDSIAYASVIIGLLVTFTYPEPIIVYSLLTAVAIAAVSYLLYRYGQMGAGDGFEFIALSLMLPIWQSPILTNIDQFNMPFILSLFIATGAITIVGVPIYYLMIYKPDAQQSKAEAKIGHGRKEAIQAAVLLLAYLALYGIIYEMVGFNYVGFMILLVIAVPSAVIMAAGRRINIRMVRWIYPDRLEPGDSIAVNMMGNDEVRFFSKRSKRFGRLATERLISEVRSVRRKIPEYRNAVPLSLGMFFGLIIALLLGNLLLLVI